MVGRQRTGVRILVAGLILVVLGVAFLVARYLTERGERHSYTSGLPPARYVDVQNGKRYWLAVPGGVAHEAAEGMTPAQLRCSAQERDGATFRLDVAHEDDGTKMNNVIGSFQAPRTAPVHVTCDRLGAVYLDNTSGDPSGLLLVLATVTMTVGFPLLLSGLRSITVEARADDAQIQPRRLKTM